MQSSTIERSRTPQAGSSTITLTGTSTPAAPEIRIPDGTLLLRGASASNRRVTWGEDVVDNEGLGRKKSKICCIFKKQRDFGESSSESSSDDSDESDSGGEGGRGHGHDANGDGHQHGDSCSHGKRRRKPKGSPNAYERMPKNRKDKEKKADKDEKGGQPQLPPKDPAPPAPENKEST